MQDREQARWRHDGADHGTPRQSQLGAGRRSRPILFNSEVFLFAFLPITYAAFWVLRGRTARYALLTIASYVFYGYWDYRFCAVMLFSTAVSYFSPPKVAGSTQPERRRLLATIPM